MADNKPKLLVIPGDGIGHEVIPQAVRVIEWFETNRSRPCLVSRSRVSAISASAISMVTPCPV